MAEANQCDIIGCMIIEKGLTGENISRQIFSYLDFSSLRNGRMVSKTWNQFLTQQRSIWMNFLRKIEPYLYYVDNLVYSHLNTEGTMGKALTAVLVGNSDWKNVFDSIEEQGKIEDIIDAFMSIQGFAVHGWGNSKYFTAGEYWPDEPPKIAEIFEVVHDGLEKDGHFVVEASDSDVKLASLPHGNGVVHESLSGRVNVLDHHLVQSVDQQVHANSSLHRLVELGRQD